MDIIMSCFIVIFVVGFITSPLWLNLLIEYLRMKSVNIGDIWIEYYDKKNPFRGVRRIFKVIDKKNNYIQFEEFRTTDDAINNISWYDDDRKIDDMPLRWVARDWKNYVRWYKAE